MGAARREIIAEAEDTGSCAFSFPCRYKEHAYSAFYQTGYFYVFSFCHVPHHLWIPFSFELLFFEILVKIHVASAYHAFH